jgi:hypothetical protein
MKCCSSFEIVFNYVVQFFIHKSGRLIDLFPRLDCLNTKGFELSSANLLSKLRFAMRRDTRSLPVPERGNKCEIDE